ncbi:hypothetical protein PILCRDRAFT_813240 [Piloderma croceum F 1598]|uniref:Uncharacterized protein n=1 Tax=Piloderma croceum (strain F 1598) TaxID=765440 RepID=A0A0C3FYP3_PILCF|nr:hypothetical protein PILCRDRAFT_813240 [Piloderma croceum F 1598]
MSGCLRACCSPKFYGSTFVILATVVDNNPRRLAVRNLQMVLRDDPLVELHTKVWAVEGGLSEHENDKMEVDDSTTEGNGINSRCCALGTK